MPDELVVASKTSCCDQCSSKLNQLNHEFMNYNQLNHEFNHLIIEFNEQLLIFLFYF